MMFFLEKVTGPFKHGNFLWYQFVRFLGSIYIYRYNWFMVSPLQKEAKKTPPWTSGYISKHGIFVAIHGVFTVFFPNKNQSTTSKKFGSYSFGEKMFTSKQLCDVWDDFGNYTTIVVSLTPPKKMKIHWNSPKSTPKKTKYLRTRFKKHIPKTKISQPLALQIPCKKVFRYPKPTPKLLAKGSSEHKGTTISFRNPPLVTYLTFLPCPHTHTHQITISYQIPRHPGMIPPEVFCVWSVL